MTPATWSEMLASFDDETDLVLAVVRAAAQDAERGTLLLFDEFALDVQVVNGKHRLGLYAAKVAPRWVNAQFAFDLLNAVHDTMAAGANCSCMRDVTIVTRDTECN
jgi:hypothetical protein